jgi:hypothetical protein
MTMALWLTHEMLRESMVHPVRLAAVFERKRARYRPLSTAIAEDSTVNLREDGLDYL